MIVEDKTRPVTDEVRCPACHGLLKVRPLELGGDRATRWTGEINVHHADPTCDWFKVAANVSAWLHAELLRVVS